jgi:hypothetical protein
MGKSTRLLSLVVATSVLLTPSPAGAQFTLFIEYVRKGYEVYQSLQNRPSDAAILQGLIAKYKSEIISELGAITAANISSCANNAVDTFEKINLLSPDNVQAFAISSDRCVTDAQAQIGALSDKKAVNQIGVALNIVGPIALAANAYAHLPTDSLKQRIMQANRQLITRLKPYCDVSILSPGELPRYSGTVRGRGACYNFTIAPPARIAVGQRGGVFYLTPGPGRAFLPWQVWGKAIPDDEVLYWRGHTAYWPRVDTSIAALRVMEGTSWQLAQEALDRLSSPALPYGSPLALAVSPDAIYKPVAMYLASGGQFFQGALNTSPDLDNPTFAGWSREESTFVSTAAATNSDGRIEQFGINRIGAVFHRWQFTPADSTSWSPFAQFDGQLNSISVARNRNGTLQVFGTNPFGNVWTRNQILGGDRFEQVQVQNPRPATNTWSDWRRMDGSLIRLAATAGPSGLISLLGMDSAGRLFFRRQLQPNAADPAAAGGWGAWESIGAPGPVGNVAVANDLGGRLNLFIQTTQGQVFQCFKSTAPCTKWVAIPGTMQAIAAGKQGGGAGRLVLVGRGTDGRYYENTSTGVLVWSPEGYITGPWRGWRLISNPPFPRRVPPIPLDPGRVLQP